MPDLTVRERAVAAYLRITGEENPHGFQTWLRRELVRHGVPVSDPTITRWLKAGVPVDRLPDVDSVLSSLEHDALREAAERLRADAWALVAQLEELPFRNMADKYAKVAREVARDIDAFVALVRR